MDTHSGLRMLALAMILDFLNSCYNILKKPMQPKSMVRRMERIFPMSWKDIGFDRVQLPHVSFKVDFL